MTYIQLFTFADTFRGRYDDSLQGAKKFYPSESGYQVLVITRNAAQLEQQSIAVV